MNKEPSLDYIIEDLVKSLRGTEEDWQIKSIKAFILKALKSQREEIVEEIEKESGIAVTLNNDILLSKERIINLIKEDE